MKKILHLLAAGNVGGIEKLCLDIYMHSALENSFCFFWEEGVYAKALKDAGASTIFLNIRRHSFLRSLRTISDFCKQHKIEAIIAHHASPLIWIMAGWLKRKMHLKLYIYVHSGAKHTLEVGTKKEIIKKITWSYAYRKSNKIIAISQSVKNSLLKNSGVDAKKIEIIYNGIDCQKYHNKNRHIPSNKGRIQIAYIGRLVPLKGVQVLLNALAICGENIYCSIIGEGSYQEELEKLASELNIADRVEFCGRQNNIEEWLKDTDVFAYPILFEEGFGLSMVEAMASGCLCIGFAKGALPEIIIHGDNGFLAEADNEKEFARQLKYIIDNIEDKSMMKISDNAVKTAAKYNIESMAKRLDGMLADNL